MTGDGVGTNVGLEPPARTLDVEPTRVRGSGGGPRRGLMALAAILVAIGVAVVLAQPGPQLGPRVPSVASPVAVVASQEAGVLRATPARLRPADLATAVHDGELEGRLVFVDGALDVTPVHCQSLREGWRGCVKLVIPGIGVPVWAADALHPWPGDPPAGSWLVTVARTGGLVYLGSLLPDRERVAGITALEAKLDSRGVAASAGGALYEVDGSLVPLPRRTCADGCTAGSPILVDKLASVSELMSTSGIPVVVGSGTPDVDVDAAVVQGTFLVARVADGMGWRVAARYLPARSIRVLSP